MRGLDLVSLPEAALNVVGPDCGGELSPHFLFARAEKFSQRVHSASVIAGARSAAWQFSKILIRWIAFVRESMSISGMECEMKNRAKVEARSMSEENRNLERSWNFYIRKQR